MRYCIAAVLVLFSVHQLGVPPEQEPIIPYLRKKAKSPADFVSGLAVARGTRRGMAICAILIAIALVIDGLGTHN
jgi:hypothetical protein